MTLLMLQKGIPMRHRPVLVLLLVLVACALAGCPAPDLHHPIRGDIRLKDHRYILITADFLLDSPDALQEVRAKEGQLRLAMALAFRDHDSHMLEGRGRRNVANALRAISRQVLSHPVKKITITEYRLHDT
ncbi:hypothetical protein JCM14469_23210 [Desulfatiferula olefinivorans]